MNYELGVDWGVRLLPRAICQRDHIVLMHTAELISSEKTNYFADYQLVYWLGPERGFISLDSEWLAVRIGPDQRVAEARIVRD